MTHAELEDLVTRFTDAFNREDLDGVMAYFADDGVYDEFDGQRRVGKDAIRRAFEPQFRGDFGHDVATPVAQRAGEPVDHVHIVDRQPGGRADHRAITVPG